MTPRNRIIPYDRKLRSLARALRKNGTPAEARLWRVLKGNALGYEFHRQDPMDDFIVDFFCHERNLAVEIDGCSHNQKERHSRDQVKDERLKSLGIRVVRFSDAEVMRNTAAVLDAIQSYLDDNELLPDADGRM
jgi:very-short-patch-repair endonuclease